MKTVSDFIFEKTEVEDSGSMGKKFESCLLKAFDLIDLNYNVNGANGRMWDVRPVGDGWNKLITDKDVNIKTANTKWLFSSSEMVKLLPWDTDELPESFDKEKLSAKVRRLFNKYGVPMTYIMKPKSDKIQNDIIKATQNKDKDLLLELLVKKNFNFDRLGRNYNIRILDNGSRVTSIAVDKGGKVWMRSEKPRKMGGGMSVTFRTPTPKISKVDRTLKTV